MRLKILKLFWDITAKNFGHIKNKAVLCPTSLEIFNQYIHLLQLTALLDFLKFIKGKIVLDAGCGTGRWEDTLINSGAKYIVGIDISTSMIYNAKKKEYGNVNLDFIIGSVTDMPIRSNSIDLIWCVTVLQHIIKGDDFERSVEGFIRVLKGNGLVVVLEFLSNFIEKTQIIGDFPMAIRPINEFISTFRRFNCKIIAMNGVDLLFFKQILDKLKVRILKDRDNVYLYQLFSHKLSLKFRLLKLIYNFLLAICLVFDIPLDLALRNILIEHCRHKVFLLKCTECAQF